jgi:hypothetical protein
MSKFFVLIVAMCILPGTVFADSTNRTELLERLVGRWILSGTIAGKKTTHDVSAEWVLNHGYLRLHEVAREKDTAGAPAYEAIIFVSMDSASG